MIEYDSREDYGEKSTSGTWISGIVFHQYNAFKKSELEEIKSYLISSEYQVKRVKHTGHIFLSKIWHLVVYLSKYFSKRKRD